MPVHTYPTPLPLAPSSSEVSSSEGPEQDEAVDQLPCTPTRSTRSLSFCAGDDKPSGILPPHGVLPEPSYEISPSSSTTDVVISSAASDISICNTPTTSNDKNNAVNDSSSINSSNNNTTSSSPANTETPEQPKPAPVRKKPAITNKTYTGPQVTDKNPIMLLNEMKSDCVYDLVREDGEPHARTFSYNLVVDKQTFNGTGKNYKPSHYLKTHKNASKYYCSLLSNFDFFLLPTN